MHGSAVIDAVSRPARPKDGAWLGLEACSSLIPPRLLPWLAEPGLLTQRVREAGGSAIEFRLLRLAAAPLSADLRARLQVSDTGCLLREVEFACGGERWIYAQSVFPDSSLARYPWLADLGDSPLGEALRRVGNAEREPLEYCEVPDGSPLAQAARPEVGAPVWARRAVYRLAGAPILVQEVFLPALLRGVPSREV
ncbi:MAG TPA: chorismate lyase [Steroidobacteraceae bacterium]|nr:chorismate lyase [Steroidobacteraceae bacterium]